MAYKYNIQYVNFYTDGSTAKKVAPVRTAPKVTLPKPKKRKRRVLYVDPLAILGIFVAVCMMIMMFVGLILLRQEQNRTRIMDHYVTHLSQQNQLLNEKYNAGYDLEEVEKTALALGMVPQNQVKQTIIHIPAEEAPEVPHKTTFLTQIYTLLNGLFA